MALCTRGDGGGGCPSCFSLRRKLGAALRAWCVGRIDDEGAVAVEEEDVVAGALDVWEALVRMLEERFRAGRRR